MDAEERKLLLEQGMQKCREGLYAGCIEAMRQVLTADVEVEDAPFIAGEAYYFIAACQMKMQQWSEATVTAREALRALKHADPRRSYLIYIFGAARLMMQKDDDAFATFEQLKNSSRDPQLAALASMMVNFIAARQAAPLRSRLSTNLFPRPRVLSEMARSLNIKPADAVELALDEAPPIATVAPGRVPTPAPSLSAEESEPQRLYNAPPRRQKTRTDPLSRGGDSTHIRDMNIPETYTGPGQHLANRKRGATGIMTAPVQGTVAPGQKPAFPAQTGEPGPDLDRPSGPNRTRRSLATSRALTPIPDLGVVEREEDFILSRQRWTNTGIAMAGSDDPNGDEDPSRHRMATGDLGFSRDRMTTGRMATAPTGPAHTPDLRERVSTFQGDSLSPSAPPVAAQWGTPLGMAPAPQSVRANTNHGNPRTRQPSSQGYGSGSGVELAYDPQPPVRQETARPRAATYADGRMYYQESAFLRTAFNLTRVLQSMVVAGVVVAAGFYLYLYQFTMSDPGARGFLMQMTGYLGVILAVHNPIAYTFHKNQQGEHNGTNLILSFTGLLLVCTTAYLAVS